MMETTETISMTTLDHLEMSSADDNDDNNNNNNNNDDDYDDDDRVALTTCQSKGATCTATTTITDRIASSSTQQDIDNDDDDADGGGRDSKRSAMLNIKRRVYTQDSLEKAYPSHRDEFSFTTYIKRQLACSLPRARKACVGYLPVIGVISNYKWRTDLVGDIIAGVCVAFLHLPQGLAMGLLASLPPAYGLYASFFPTLLYVLFGTSRHSSVGTNAIISLLIAAIIDSQLQTRGALVVTHDGHDSATATPTTTTQTSMSSSTTMVTAVNDGISSTDFKTDSEEDLLAFKVGVATSVGLLTGLYLTVAGLLRMGFVCRYFSTAFLGGFTTATAVQIVISQLSKLLNIQITAHSGAGKAVKIVVDVFRNIGAANPADVIISVISVTFLLGVTIGVNERFKDKLKVPVPVQLILVAVATTISHFADLEGRYGVAVVGAVPAGLPSPSVPNIGAYPGIMTESIMVAVLTLTISMSLAKLTAKIHDYDIDDNQEFLAYGLCNTLSSFFGCFTSCNNPPRAMVLSGVGARSTLHGVVSAILILLVLLVAGPLFRALPVAVLAAMICAALKNLLLQVRQIPFFWRANKSDFVVWILTCLISIFMGLDIGIVAGVLISFLTIIVNSQLTSGTTGAISVGEDLVHLNGDREGVNTSDEFEVFYFPSQLYFANVDKFKNELFSKTCNPSDRRQIRERSNDGKESTNSEVVNVDSENNLTLLMKFIILDCSAMTYMDLDGAYTIKTVSYLYKKCGISVLLTNCADCVLNLIEKVDYFESIPRDSVFYSVHDALHFIQQTKQLRNGHLT